MGKVDYNNSVPVPYLRAMPGDRWEWMKVPRILGCLKAVDPPVLSPHVPLPPQYHRGFI
jgi:hypothetical protein